MPSDTPSAGGTHLSHARSVGRRRAFGARAGLRGGRRGGVGRRVEDPPGRPDCPATGTDVGALQGGGSAERWPPRPPRRWSCACRARRARCRTASRSCSSNRGCSSVARATVTPASSTRRASGYGWRVEKSVAGRNVATGRLPASASMSASDEIGAVVDGRAAELDGQLHARARPNWLACRRRPSPAARPASQHGAALVGVERAALAEGVDPAGVRRAGGEHRAADERRRSRRHGRRTRRHDVGAEERRLRRELGGDAQAACLVVDVSP